LWEFPGGKKKTRELLYEAIKREIQEELGIKVEPKNKIYLFEHCYPLKVLTSKIENFK